MFTLSSNEHAIAGGEEGDDGDCRVQFQGGLLPVRDSAFVEDGGADKQIDDDP